MDNVSRNTISLVQRSERIAQRAREIMLQDGVNAAFFSSHGPAWTGNEIAARDAALEKARFELELEFGLPTWEPPGELSDAVVDWSAEPMDGLKIARREYASCLIVRDNCAANHERAIQRRIGCEQELDRYHDLAQQIDAFYAQCARDGTDDSELPYHLASGLKDQAVGLDRLEHANKAERILASEARVAERELQQRKRVVNLWKGRVLAQRAEKDVFAAQEMRTEWLDIMAMVIGYSQVSFPGCGGPAVTANIQRALDQLPEGTTARPYPEQTSKWLAMFDALDDDDAAIE